MHPSFWAWRCAKRGGHAMREHCGPGDEHFDGGGGGLGVRRPLRFLTHQLDLDDAQIGTLARILDELKIERAQGEVDRRRTVAALADALSSDPFDLAKATEGSDLRLKSEERFREAILKALQQIHAVLKPEQRARLAYLFRTGRLAI